MVEVLTKVKETTNTIKLSPDYIKSLMLKKGNMTVTDFEGDVDMSNLDDETRAQLIQQQLMFDNMASDKNERATNWKIY